MSNLPPEPDEFQTRMRQPDGGGENESAAQAGEQPPAAPSSPFAPPGGGPDPAPQPPAAPSTAPAPPGQPEPQPPAGYGQPTAPFGQVSQPGGYGQVSQPGGYGQPPQGPPTTPFGQQPPAPQAAPQQPPFGGYPQGGYGAPGQPGQPGQPGPWGQQQAPRDANPLRAAFDFSFQTYATPGIVKIIYIIGVVVGVLVWLLYIIAGFSVGALSPYGDSNPILGILALLFGWIPVLLWILLLRVGLETALANVRTATDVRVLRTRSDEDAAAGD